MLHFKQVSLMLNGSGMNNGRYVMFFHLIQHLCIILMYIHG